jgi:hypothetical protein
MEWVLVALVLLVAVALWAMVKMMELALAWKMVERVQETQTDLDLQALMESWKEKD